MSTSDSTLPAPVREDLVLLAGHLLSSARGLLEEPADYGPMRCLAAAGRVLELLERVQASEPQLVTVRTRIDDVVSGPQNDKDLSGLLDGLCEQVAVSVTRPAPVGSGD